MPSAHLHFQVGNIAFIAPLHISIDSHAFLGSIDVCRDAVHCRSQFAVLTPATSSEVKLLPCSKPRVGSHS